MRAAIETIIASRPREGTPRRGARRTSFAVFTVFVLKKDETFSKFGTARTCAKYFLGGVVSRVEHPLMMLRLRETSFRAPATYDLVFRRSSFGSRGIPAGRTRASRRVTVMSYGPPPAGYMPSADEQLANRPRCVSPRLVARRASDRSSRRVPRAPLGKR